jgi:hypothetical protein
MRMENKRSLQKRGGRRINGTGGLNEGLEGKTELTKEVQPYSVQIVKVTIPCEFLL